MAIKIYSWNVNGIRSVLKKGALQEFIKTEKPDILCVQETKAKPGQAEVDFPEYEEILHSAKRPGYSGTAIFTKLKPLKVFYDALAGDFADSFGDPLEEGRVLVTEFKHFYLVNVYTPNSKRGLERLSLRAEKWDPGFLEMLKKLEKTKPVVVCGDFNAAHTEIDLARPKENTKNAGFTAEERRGIAKLIDAGFIDTFRTLHPDSRRYTWWSHWGAARANNVGWRIDYFFISKNLQKNLRAAEIYEAQLGSDHCPISLTLDFGA